MMPVVLNLKGVSFLYFKGKEGTDVPAAAVLLTSVSCKTSPTRVSSSNTVFPCFFKTSREIGTRLRWRGSNNISHKSL